MPSELNLDLHTNVEDCVVACLEAGIPLSLLLDLSASDPHSKELYALERAT